MPFLAAAVPAIIGAAGSVGAGLLGGRGSGKGIGDVQKQNMAQGEEENKRRNSLVDANNPVLNYFTKGGDPTKTKLYKSEYSSGMEETASAYDSAKAAQRTRANAAGFGYEQPTTQGSEDAINVAEARTQADVPRKALGATIGPELQAAGMRAGEASLYNPAPYYGMNTDLGIASSQQKSGLWKSVMGLLGNKLPGLIPNGGGDSGGVSDGGSMSGGDFLDSLGGFSGG